MAVRLYMEVVFLKEYLFDVLQQSISGPKNVELVAGSAEIYTAVFRFDPTWDSFARTAVFECEDERREQLLINDRCIIPWEILRAEKYVRVGVYGVNSNAVMPTIYSELMFVSKGAEPSEAAQDHSPGVFDQIAEIGQQAVDCSEAANEAKEIAVEALHAFHTPTASAVTLPAESAATVSYDGQNFSFGIPRGLQGNAGAPGKSAYASAKDGGYAKSEAAFQADLAAIGSKQNASDNSLQTTDKTVTGAINELAQGKANSSDLAAVATSGSYNDLADKPTIPAAHVNADWNADSGAAQILNKPTIPTVPANVSAFANDAGYLTGHQSLSAYRTACAQDAIDNGKVAKSQGVAHAGEFLVVGSDGNVKTMTLQTWQGGSY